MYQVVSGLVYNACQLELAGVSMLENVNELRHFEACLRSSATKFPLTQVRLPFESKRLA